MENKNVQTMSNEELENVSGGIVTHAVNGSDMADNKLRSKVLNDPNNKLHKQAVKSEAVKSFSERKDKKFKSF